VNVDGRTLFLQFADKVAKGELVVTEFYANVGLPNDDARFRGVLQTWDGVDVNVNVTARTSKAENRSEPARAVKVSHQVRELIFDEPSKGYTPVFDEDLA